MWFICWCQSTFHTGQTNPHLYPLTFGSCRMTQARVFIDSSTDRRHGAPGYAPIFAPLPGRRYDTRLRERRWRLNTFPSVFVHDITLIGQSVLSLTENKVKDFIKSNHSSPCCFPCFPGRLWNWMWHQEKKKTDTGNEKEGNGTTVCLPQTEAALKSSLKMKFLDQCITCRHCTSLAHEGQFLLTCADSWVMSPVALKAVLRKQAWWHHQGRTVLLRKINSIDMFTFKFQSPLAAIMTFVRLQ